MSRRIAPTLVLLGSLPFTGCSEPPRDFEPPDRARQVAEARAEFSTALFDTVSWAPGEDRAMEGNLVYASHCRSCHGTVGEGGTDYALERGLEVPSLVDPAPLRGNVRDSVLEIIYTGHVRGMPTWGVAGISPREIDAVTYYLLQVLRPEVLGGERGSGSD